MNQEQWELVIRALIDYEDTLISEQGSMGEIARQNLVEELRVIHEVLEIAYERITDYE